MIDLSICPSFECNMKCKFCYIREHDDSRLSLFKLAKVLKTNEIRNLDVYGGEITCLPSIYSSLMMIIIEYFYKGDIRFISNGLRIPEFWLNKFIKHNIGFSIDKSRTNRDIVYENIRSFDRIGKKFSILTVDIDDIDDKFISSLNNVESVTIKPYSKPINGNTYESKMLYSYKRLYLENKCLFDKLELTQKDRDTIAHNFLLPDGNLYDIQYKNNLEYFEKVQKCNQKPDMKCLTCQYYKKCFNEHYNGYVVPDNMDCIGRKEVMRFLDEIHNIH